MLGKLTMPAITQDGGAVLKISSFPRTKMLGTKNFREKRQGQVVKSDGLVGATEDLALVKKWRARSKST